jgi:hypothetical protein
MSETATSARRVPGRPFPKGASPNPAGRPRKEFDVVAIAKKHSPTMMGILVEIATNSKNSPSVRKDAAAEVLNRAYGRPRQAVDLNAEVDFGEAFNAFVRRIVAGDAAKVIEHDDETAGALANEGRILGE